MSKVKTHNTNVMTTQLDITFNINKTSKLNKLTGYFFI
jgi:hypothetical protein